MRTQQPHPSQESQRDVVPAGGLPDSDGTDGASSLPGRGLCCPDDPLDLVIQLFPADRAPPPSLAALGIGAGGEPPRPVKQEPQSPQPLAESAYGGGGLWDSLGFSSSFLLDGLRGLEEIDVDMFFADDALDGGGEKTEGNLFCDPTEAKPNDAPPLPAPMPAGAFPLQAYDYDACRAFHGAVFNNAFMPAMTAAPMPPAGGPPPVVVSNNSTPPPVFVANNSTPPLPALIMPAAGLHACRAYPGIASNGAPTPPPLPVRMPLAAAGPHAYSALPGIASIGAPAPPPPPLMVPMPPFALHPNAALAAGVYSISNAPAHAPPSATPSSSPPSRASSSGSGLCPSSATSEPEFLQPQHAWVVPRKQRSPPSVNRRKRPWVLDFPLRALPPVAPPPPANPGAGDDDDDAKNQYALVPVVPPPPPPPGNTGGGGGSGGIRRRRPVPRQRNRQAQRECSHCHSAETPQWRAGPDGPGTLCNACGIRYAAKKLLPEYRPSTAPSFRSGQHSNRHRKVIKLREQMKAAAATEEEKPSSEQQHQPVEDDDRTEKEDDRTEEDDDDEFMDVCAYISAAGL